MESKLQRLQEIIRESGSALVAYSGGIDSAFLLKVAVDQLGSQAVAFTAFSPSFPSYEKERAIQMAREIGAKHLIVESHEVEDPNYRANRGDRCYFCKSELYEIASRKAAELGLKTIFNGTHRDDLGDVRPGLKAAGEFGVRSPLLEADLGKAEIRELAREMGLSIWDKPAMACLSSRFPPGVEVNEERLRRIDRIESGLAALGFRIFRVRFHEPVARIEVASEEIGRFSEDETRRQINELCRQNGFTDAAIDLDGYRTGGASGTGGQRIQILGASVCSQEDPALPVRRALVGGVGGKSAKRSPT